MRSLLAAICFASLLAGASDVSAEVLPPVTHALNEICLRAEETPAPPRDLAESAGYAAQPSIPSGVRPTTPFSRAWRSPGADELYVVSTVMGPPASPYSCMVAAYGEDAALEAGAIETLLGSRASAYSENVSQRQDVPGVSVRKYDRNVEGAVYSVLVIQDVRELPTAHPNIVAVVYCVGCSYDGSPRQ